MSDGKSMVIDLTYICNFTCHYCQWGDPTNDKRKPVPLKDLLVPESSLRNLGTERVAFSGGEPLLHPSFRDIIRYYSGKVTEIVTITNGLLFDKDRISDFSQDGLTGITFSLDSFDAARARATRDMSAKIMKSVVRNIGCAVKARNDGLIEEVGLNVVVSSGNCNPVDIQNTLDTASSMNLDFVKFQPIFDDGYVSQNAPHLKLRSGHFDSLLKIAEMVENSTYGFDTNKPHFWRTLAEMVNGSKLLGRACGIDDRQSIAIGGEVKFCYWVNKPVYGNINDNLSSECVIDARGQFMQAKEECRTGEHCFCLQDINHQWGLA